MGSFRLYAETTRFALRTELANSGASSAFDWPPTLPPLTTPFTTRRSLGGVFSLSISYHPLVVVRLLSQPARLSIVLNRRASVPAVPRRLPRNANDGVNELNERS